MMVELLSIGAACCVLAVVVFTLATTGTMIQGWLKPLHQQWSDRAIAPGFTVKYKPCCPPGLGCNDPLHHAAGCRRALVFKLATPDELDRLELAWAEYNRLPSYEALTTWEDARDAVIRQRLTDADPAIRKRLLGVTETIELVRGTPDGREP